MKILIDDPGARMDKKPESELKPDTCIRFENHHGHFNISFKDGELYIRKTGSIEICGDQIKVSPLASNGIYIQ